MKEPEDCIQYHCTKSQSQSFVVEVPVCDNRPMNALCTLDVARFQEERQG